jgi:hypothetical protein
MSKRTKDFMNPKELLVGHVALERNNKYLNNQALKIVEHYSLSFVDDHINEDDTDKVDS